MRTTARAKEKSKVVDVRVGDVKAGQVVRGITEEVEQSIAGQCDHLWDSLVSPGFRHYQTTETEEERKKANIRCPVLMFYLKMLWAKKELHFWSCRWVLWTTVGSQSAFHFICLRLPIWLSRRSVNEPQPMHHQSKPQSPSFLDSRMYTRITDEEGLYSVGNNPGFVFSASKNKISSFISLSTR